MPTARELLEQVDALMRRNQGAGPVRQARVPQPQGALGRGEIPPDALHAPDGEDDPLDIDADFDRHLEEREHALEAALAQPAEPLPDPSAAPVREDKDARGVEATHERGVEATPEHGAEATPESDAEATPESDAEAIHESAAEATAEPAAALGTIAADNFDDVPELTEVVDEIAITASVTEAAAHLERRDEQRDEEVSVAPADTGSAADDTITLAAAQPEAADDTIPFAAARPDAADDTIPFAAARPEAADDTIPFAAPQPDGVDDEITLTGALSEAAIGSAADDEIALAEVEFDAPIGRAELDAHPGAPEVAASEHAPQPKAAEPADTASEPSDAPAIAQLADAASDGIPELTDAVDDVDALIATPSTVAVAVDDVDALIATPSTVAVDERARDVAPAPAMVAESSTPEAERVSAPTQIDVAATAPKPAGPTSSSLSANDLEDARWQSLANDLRMQLLQRIDMFTDVELQSKLRERVQPVVDRASAEIMESIHREVTDVLRSYVAQAVEREIERMRNPHP